MFLVFSLKQDIYVYSRVAGELSKVLTFCKVKIGSPASGIPSLVGKKSKKKAGPGSPPAVMCTKVGVQSW